MKLINTDSVFVTLTSLCLTVACDHTYPYDRCWHLNAPTVSEPVNSQFVASSDWTHYLICAYNLYMYV